MQNLVFFIIMAFFVQLSSISYAAPYTDNGDGTITDRDSGLMWQKTDYGTPVIWEDALAYCEGLSLGGKTDWRVPNVKELETLVDDTKNAPAINVRYFPTTLADWYWSSTTHNNSYIYAWFVNFNDGMVQTGSKAGGYYVRCVR